MSKVLFAESVHGAMHKEREMPKEDAVGIKEGNGYQIFVTADGHGDKECVRSAKGAQLAVDIGIQKLEAFYAAVSENHLTSELMDERLAERRIRKLIGSIIGMWNVAVAEDVATNPFTEEELQTAVKTGEYYRKNEHITHAYGTTILAGILTEEYLLLLHQGDGHCIVVDANGKTVEPVPWDEKCISNIVTSICDSDAVSACRYAVISRKENEPAACFLASDGVDDSFFTLEETYAFCHKLIRYGCKEGMDKLQENLRETLESLSERGSRDDTTISGFIDVEQCLKFLEEFEKYDQRLQIENQLKQVDEKLNSMQRKKAFLEEKAMKATKERIHCEEESAKKKNVLSEITDFIKKTQEKLVEKQEELDASSKDMEQISQDVVRARDVEEKAIVERNEYLERYDMYEAKKAHLLKELEELEDFSQEKSKGSQEEPAEGKDDEKGIREAAEEQTECENDEKKTQEVTECEPEEVKNAGATEKTAECEPEKIEQREATEETQNISEVE